MPDVKASAFPLQTSLNSIARLPFIRDDGGGTFSNQAILMTDFYRLNVGTIVDPATNAAVDTATIDNFEGVAITLTAAANPQTLQTPTNVAPGKIFYVFNDNASTGNVEVNGISLVPSNVIAFCWTGTLWISIISNQALNTNSTPTFANAHSTNPPVVNNHLTTKEYVDIWNTDAINDPAVNAAVTTAKIDTFRGTKITLTAAGNNQVLQPPTNIAPGRIFAVINDGASTDTIIVNGITLSPGEVVLFFWRGVSWSNITPNQEVNIGSFSSLGKLVLGGTGFNSNDSEMEMRSTNKVLSLNRVATAGEATFLATAQDGSIWYNTSNAKLRLKIAPAALEVVYTGDVFLDTDGDLSAAQMLTIHTARAGAGNVQTFTLAKASDRREREGGRPYCIVNRKSGGTLTVSASGGDTIDGAASIVIPNGESAFVHQTGLTRVSMLRTQT